MDSVLQYHPLWPWNTRTILLWGGVGDSAHSDTLSMVPSASRGTPGSTESLLRQGELTGDWFGMRSGLESAGIVVETALAADGFANVAGGAKRGSTALYNLDLTLSLDAGEMFSWPGATFFAYVLGNYGGSPTEYAGDLQGISNIDAPQALRVYELWFEQTFFDRRISLRGGLYDLNSEFYVTESALLFINATQGIGPELALTGANGPSIFPVTSLAARLRLNLAPSLYFLGAVFDAVPGDPADAGATAVMLRRKEGALLTSEIGRQVGRPHTPGYSKLALGAWTYSRPFERIASSRVGTSHGVYLLADTRLFSEAKAPKEGLNIFGHVGWASPRVNPVTLGWGAGLSYDGLVPGRSHDTAGIAIAAAHYGAPFLSVQRANGDPAEAMELALEATYAAAVTPWLSLQPDMQYVINSGLDSSLANAWVLGLRCGLVL